MTLPDIRLLASSSVTVRVPITLHQIFKGVILHWADRSIIYILCSCPLFFLRDKKSLCFLRCVVLSWCVCWRGYRGSLKIEVYRKPTHTDQYLLFDSHHPHEHKLGVIITLHHQADYHWDQTQGAHLRKALKPYRYSDLVFAEAVKIQHTIDTQIIIPYIAEVIRFTVL